MAIPPEVLSLLRQGETLAARVPASREGWLAWVWVCPMMRGGRTFRDAAHAWTLARVASAPYDEEIARFEVRYIELSKWHLDDRWLLDLDVAVRERPIMDERSLLESESELETWLSAHGAVAEELSDPDLVGYPHPPRT